MKRRHDFNPVSYKLAASDDVSTVVIEGQKEPPPSKRITLKQKNIRITKAKIIHKHKKGDIEFEVKRINLIKSFEEIRLHTHNVLYSGIYVVTLEFKGELDESGLGEKNP